MVPEAVCDAVINQNWSSTRCLDWTIPPIVLAAGLWSAVAQASGSGVRETGNCDFTHGRLNLIHRSPGLAVDNAVGFAVDKTVNNVMVRLATSAHHGPRTCRWPVILRSASATSVSLRSCPC